MIFSDVVHNASNNMLSYRPQPAVVCVAQVKSTVNLPKSILSFKQIVSFVFTRKLLILLEQRRIVRRTKKSFAEKRLCLLLFF